MCGPKQIVRQDTNTYEIETTTNEIHLNDSLNDAFILYQDEETESLFDTSSTSKSSKKLSKKRKDVKGSMPKEYTARNLKKLLGKQDRLVTDLETEENSRIYDQGDLDATQAEIEEIDRVLNMYAEGQSLDEDAIFNFDEEEMQQALKSLRFKKSRDLTQLLINEHSKGDSPEMKALKAEVLRLTYRLEEVKNNEVTREEIDDLCTYYEIAIKFCDDYLSTKKHNARYDKVFDVWQSLCYEKDSLALIRDEDFSEKEDFTMGELLGMSSNNKIKRRHPKKKEAKAQENRNYSEGTRKALQVFDKNYSVADAYNRAGIKLKDIEKLAQQNYELLKGINEFLPGKVQVLDISVFGKKVRILQDGENGLFVLDKHERVPLGVTAQDLRTQIIEDMMLRSEYYSGKAIKDLVVYFEEQTDITLGDYTRTRNHLTEYLKLKLGLTKDAFNNVSRANLMVYVKGLAIGSMTAEQIKEEIKNAKSSEELINGIELTELLELDAARGDQLSDHVSMYKVQAQDDKNVWSEDEKKVKNLMAELVYSNDTLIMDQNATRPAEYVRKILSANVDALKILINNPNDDFIDTIMKKMSLDKVEGEGQDNFADSIARALRGFVVFLREKKYDSIKSAIDNGNDAEMNAMLQQTHNVMETGITASSNIMQKNVDKIVDAMFEQTEEEENNDPLLQIMKRSTKIEGGQGKFIRNVLKNYFAKMKTIDQRAMLASALRSCKEVVFEEYDDYELLSEMRARRLTKYKGIYDKSPRSLTNEDKVLLEQYREQKKSLQIGANYFAGLIRGAGPLLHKMLQAVPEESLPKEIRLALRDVKSKLPPIPERVVKTQMNAMIERSKGTITKIDVVKNLGAASVGQTFLCRIYGPKIAKEGKNVVIKLLRPDCQNRMKREEKVMLDCAKDVNEGMYETYKGQLSNYYMELDLTKEAKNIEEGAIYNNRYGDVVSEKVCKDIEPTPNSIMIEESPGKTLDDILLDAVKTREEIYNDIHDKGVNIKGKPVVFSSITISYESIKKTTEAKKKLTKIANDLIQKRDIMANITKVWIEEALFGTGYYHADLHAGNILLSKDMGTLIDYGNAVRFSEDQRKSITKMMTAAATSGVDMFFIEFNKLLDMSDQKFKDFYTKEKQAEVKEEFRKILNMGDEDQAGDRISAALIRASELGVKLPPAIYNFSQGQLRLQKSINDINRQIKEIGEDIREIDQRMQDNDKNALGLNVVLDTALRAGRHSKNIGKNIKQQIDGIEGVSEEEFTRGLLDNTYIEGDRTLGIATIDKRDEFDAGILGDFTNFEKKLTQHTTAKKLPDFTVFRKNWNEYKAKWTKKYNDVKGDKNLSKEEKESKIKQLDSELIADSGDKILDILPDNLQNSIYFALGINGYIPIVMNSLQNLDEEPLGRLFFTYEEIIIPGIKLDRMVREFRELQDKDKLTEEQKKTMPKEIYAQYKKIIEARKKVNPITLNFMAELQKVCYFDKLKEDVKIMIEEPAEKTIEKDGKQQKVTLGKLFEEKLDEYYKIAKNYAPKEGIWSMDNMPKEDKKKVKDLVKELCDFHMEITQIQVKAFYKGRYEDEVEIKSYGFIDVMKGIIKNNFASVTANVGYLNMAMIGGKAFLDYMSSMFKK